MTEVIRRFRPAPHQPAQTPNPFRLLPWSGTIKRADSPEPPRIVIEGVPPIPQRRPLGKNET